MKLYRVHGFGCGNRAHDEEGFATKPRCAEWCGDQDKCVVALRSIDADTPTQGHVEPGSQRSNEKGVI